MLGRLDSAMIFQGKGGQLQCLQFSWRLKHLIKRMHHFIVCGSRSAEVAAEDMEEDDLIFDETLSPLEKIFLFAKSEMVFHR